MWGGPWGHIQKKTVGGGDKPENVTRRVRRVELTAGMTNSSKAGKV